MSDLKDAFSTPLPEGFRRVVKYILWLVMISWFVFWILVFLNTKDETTISRSEYFASVVMFSLMGGALFALIMLVILPRLMRIIWWVILGFKKKD